MTEIASKHTDLTGMTAGQVIGLSSDGEKLGPITPPETRVITPDVFLPATAHTNWNTLAVITTSLRNGVVQSSGAQNDEINWDLFLAAGTWSITLIHRKSNNRGIYSVQIDGVEVGTVDGYNAASTDNNVSTISGVAVAASGLKRVKLKMATKNGSSSSYVGSVAALGLLRTA